MPASLLLAGGSGTRLAGTLGSVKLLARVQGWRLVCYPLASLAVAGSPTAVIVAPRRRTGLLLDAAKECPFPPPELYAVETWRWWAGSGYTLLDALEAVGITPGIVSVADHIYHPGIPRVTWEECAYPFCVAGDRRPSLVDTREATRILAERGRVVAIGKGLTSFTHYDVGVHSLRSRPYTGKTAPPPFPLNELKRRNASKGLLGIVDVTGYPWIDVDTPADLARLGTPQGERLALLVQSVVRS